MIARVVLAGQVTKGLKKLPQHVVDKLLDWVSAVETLGLQEVRKVSGYHDEPLKGARKGQRSIRLSRSYRAFYRVEKDRVELEYVLVIDVNKHQY